MAQISVLMGAYNAEKYVNETIESVLKQSFTDFEFVIIDDGSTDRTSEIIKAYTDSRIKYFYFENSGLAKSLNRGLELCLGKYIARIDADDVCYPDRLMTQHSFMEENPDYVLCGSYADIVSETGEFIFRDESSPLSNVDIRKWIDHKNCFIHSTTFYSREEVLRIGGYYEPIKQYFEDYMLFYQLVKAGKALNIDKALIKYRITPGSISNIRYNRKYRALVHAVVKRGFITEEENIYLQTLKKKKKSKSKLLSNHYWNLARYFLVYQSNFSKLKYYIGLALKTCPLNSNIFVDGTYILFLYFKIRFRQILKLESR